MKIRVIMSLDAQTVKRLDSIDSRLASIEDTQKELKDGEEKMLLTLKTIQDAEALESAEVHQLVLLMPRILQAVASGQLDQAGAQTLLSGITADTTSVSDTIAAITAALPPEVPAESGTAQTGPGSA